MQITPTQRFIELLTKNYRANWEDTELIRELIDASSNLNYTGDDFLETYMFNRGMFIFQNPLIRDIVEECKKMDIYRDYQKNPKIKGAVLGYVMKKYPYCDIGEVAKMI